MADKSLHKIAITQVGSGGLHTDNDPLNQPKGTHRFALNGVNEGQDGEHGFISNEKANYDCTVRPEGYEIIGDCYIEDDMSVLIMVNSALNRAEIGVIEKNNIYRTIVNTATLGLRITNQCDIRYRLRRGSEKVIYWVDGLNKARTFNLNREYNFYNNTYQTYLRSGGNPNTFAGEKWDGASFDLIKSFKSVPTFNNIEITETGAILPGSYNFAIQYVDEDLNPTEWITVSNTVNIFNDSLNNPFQRIRGSRNIDTSSQSFPRANKSIKLTVGNLDDSFPYYRVAIIRAAGNTGIPEKVLASDLYPTSDSNFIYSGNDGALSEVALGDILIDEEVIFAPQHIEQLENRLLLANTKGKSINWCDFQAYASKISSDICYKDVILNTVLSDPNVKNAKSTFFFRGYMPGEVYSFGIVYLFDDGSLSPVFHIPGKSLTNVTSDMGVYELNTRYLDIHNCSTDNYWDRDMDGNTLVGKKVRHHKFPFRKDVSKPLYTTVTGGTSINRYRLSISITLNPAWTPGPIEYPKDIDGNPILIPYTFNYQITGNPGINAFNGTLVDTDIGANIILYDDTAPLDQIDPPEYSELDSTCTLATVYQISGNERFLIDFTYEVYVADTIFNTDNSQIFGIEFGNIEKPHPDVVGFYIVRNERLEDDRLILDNAIFGTMTQFSQYKSFGLIMPKPFYTADNCGRIGISGKTLQYYDKGTWFWNPEFQFFNRKTEFTEIEIEGKYSEDTVTMPTISNTDGSPCNGGSGIALNDSQGSKGIYIEDVQAGTSYNPEVHKNKDKDDDGFDLVIGYRNTTLTYAIDAVTTFPVKKRVVYLSAAAYQNFDNNTFYNVSVDNKIGMYLTDDAFTANIFYTSGDNKNHLMYGALVRASETAYANFITRPYYKEHNNPIMFGGNTTVNGVQIFNGDAMISCLTFVSSVFYDMVVAERAKKSKLWKIIVGAVLVIAAIVISVVTLGAGTPAAVAVTAGALSAMAISYGVSLAISGIKFEQYKSMIDTDYEKGLKDTVVDGGVFETIRDTIQKEDDTIRWFADRVSNIYLESTVPFGLRAGLTCGVTDFIDAPAPYDEPNFRTYLTEKLTALDRDQGSGRIYKGFASAEVYDMNLDYMRFNKEKNYVHLPVEYDCCSDKNEIFPMRVWYSQQSFQEEKIDNYRVFLPNNYRDIEGKHGEITDLYRLGNSLFIHTREGLWHLPQNVQERVTNEIVSFIGTGEFFNIPPRKVIDDTLGSGGTQHKWATVKTRNGVMFVNEVENKIYLHADKVTDISLKGMRNWFENNLKSFLVKQVYDKLGVNFSHDNNPANPNGVGYLSAYDTRFERVVITKKDYLLLPEKLDQLQLVTTVPLAGNMFVYALDTGRFYQGQTEIALNNADYFEDKSWTLSFSFHTASWISWHSYLPNYYIHSQNNMYSVNADDNRIWKHNMEGKYQTFYGVFRPFMVEYVKLSEPLQDYITEDITIQTKARKWDTTRRQYNDERFITFNKITVYNNSQCSGEQEMVIKDTAPNPQNWYQQQVNNAAGKILITRKERNWNINELRDYVVDYSQPFFTTAWDAIKSQYFIDKIADNSVISFFKPWNELQIFRDKYIVVRLKFDTFDNVNLIMNYSLETEQPSIR